jgi:ABC-type transport system involved in cytochrome bd biosynthesis fused ATPase/permease subunit
MQRAAIARCLIKNPSFVLLDEATSALDNVTERSVQQAIDRLSGSNRTSLIIAHRLGTIQKADNIIVLNNGRIVEEVSILLSIFSYFSPSFFLHFSPWLIGHPPRFARFRRNIYRNVEIRTQFD